MVNKRLNPEERIDKEMEYEDHRHSKRRQTLNMEERDIKGTVEMLREGKTEHSRNDGKVEEKTLHSKH